MNRRTKTQFVSRQPELRYLDRDEPETISGYGAIFYDGTPETEYQIAENIVERIDPGAFDGIEDSDVISTLNHDPNFLLGRTNAGTLRLNVDEVGLRYEIPIRPEDPDHIKVVSKLRANDLDGSSFWFLIESESKTFDEERNVTAWTIEKVNLIEVGPVVLPAYSATTSELRSKHVEERIRESEIVEEPKQEEPEPVDLESKKLADLFYIDAQLFDVVDPENV